MKNRIFVLGIDGVPPNLLFEEWVDELPTIKKLMDKGLYAEIQSTIPPSTILAWTAFASGRDPGEQGVYSYTYKSNQGETRLVDSTRKKNKMIWDILEKHNKRSIALYIPLTYPVNKINGCMVSGFLTPGVSNRSAYPEHVMEKIKAMKDPEVFFDVAVGLAGHRGLTEENLIEKTYEMTEMQLDLLKDLLKNEDWDFCMAVMIGTDRLQHMIWRHFDEKHRFFVKDSPHKDVLKNYYKYLDKELAKILELLDENTTIIISSDHGMVRQDGKINVNDFLVREGYLVLKEDFLKKARERFEKDGTFTKFKKDDVEWSKTKAWEVGAYQGRIYINKKSKSPLGAVEDKDYEALRDEIAEKLKNIPDDKGDPLDTRIYKPEDIYKNGFDEEAPDLIVFFDNLKWGANNDGVGSMKDQIIGTGQVNDNAGHHPIGSFIMAGYGVKQKGKISRINIMDATPTMLKLFGIEVPSDMQGKQIDID